MAGVCHLDLKLENILVGDDLQLKICDLGFAQMIDKPVTRFQGSIGYMAPEAHTSRSYSGRTADLFSLGVILYTMHFQAPPFVKAAETD